MLRYCLVNSGFTASPHLPAGVEQWPAACGGELVEPDALGTAAACARYDIIHMVYSAATLPLIAQVHRLLGPRRAARLVLSFPAIHAGRPPTDQHHALVEACARADLLFGPDYATARHYEDLIGQPVHVLAHPADLGRSAVPLRADEKIAFVMSPERYAEARRAFPQLPAPGGRARFRGRAVELISDQLGSDAGLLQRLSQFAFICLDAELEGQDAALIHLASLGCALIGGGRAEVTRRCFALSAHLAFQDTLKTLDWLLHDPDAKAYMLEYAADKLEYYNHGNSSQRLCRLLGATGRDALAPASSAAGRVVYLDAIAHASGPASVAYDINEFVVVCLVKNGAEYLPSFLRHYRRIGARHFYFIDNGSTDRTGTLLSQQPDVTVYRTALVFKKFESEMRRVIIERHCQSRWCLSVDIDELFEFPGHGSVTAADFLGYLNANRYTAVVAYMLDMFAVRGQDDSVYLEDTYTNFSLDDVTREDYFSGFEAFCSNNVLPCAEIGNYYGGVRQSHVKSGESRFLLTKHALLFIDHHLEAVTMPHFCNNARIADVTCLLKHYKLTASLKTRIEDGIKAGTFPFILKDQVAAYLSLLGAGADYTQGRGSTVYTGVDYLLDRGFLHASAAYRQHLARAARSSAVADQSGSTP
ncbi:glycosyltransferase family 2 protein [Duganella radicis]|uniref:Glycosyltransferase family 2 protein n=1 Tax=Duganella radicis TaxID=551988 RepID=A0A6L6PKW3_9BURK|nr:glycosyltransferase family 2 protein [Duganella radicis]MTV39319.1 hypothetical protein [Duganella radicis]